MKRLGIVLLLALALVGCVDDQPQEEEHDWWVETVDVNGRQVPCVFWIDEGWKVGGLSCEWEAQ